MHAAAFLPVALVCALACVAQAQPTASPTAATLPPSNIDLTGGAFAGLVASDFKETFTLPKPSQSIFVGNTDNNSSLRIADLNNRFTALAPCGIFVPHYHRVSEFFVGVLGKIVVKNLVDGKLFAHELKPYTFVEVPPRTLHYFYNPTCYQSATIATLNSNAPGFFGYYDVPKKILQERETVADLVKLVSTVPANSTFSNTLALQQLSQQCLKRCRKYSNGGGRKYWDNDDDYFHGGKGHGKGWGK